MEGFFEWFSGIMTKSGVARITNMNQSLVSQYVNGIKKPGPKQLQKVERALHDFGIINQNVYIFVRKNKK